MSAEAPLPQSWHADAVADCAAARKEYHGSAPASSDSSIADASMSNTPPATPNQDTATSCCMQTNTAAPEAAADQEMLTSPAAKPSPPLPATANSTPAAANSPSPATTSDAPLSAPMQSQPATEAAPSSEAPNQPAPAPAAALRRCHSSKAMLDIFSNMDLSVLTSKPAGWTEDRICVAISAEVVENLHNLQKCLKHPSRRAISVHNYIQAITQPAYGKTLTRGPSFDGPPADNSGPYNSPAQHTSAQLAPIRTQPGSFRRRSNGFGPSDSPSSRFSRESPSSTSSPFSATPKASLSTPATSKNAALPDVNDLGWSSFDMQDSCRTDSSICGTPTSSTAAAAAARTTSTSSTMPAVQPGSPLWQQTIKQLLGLDDSTDSAAVSWLVQQPHLAGAMGPIPAGDMGAWLLQGTAPKQLHRPVHRPMLEAVAADPAALLVCGLMAAEVDKGLVPGKAAFKPLHELLPGLALGLSYSVVTKGLVDNRRPTHKPAQRSAFEAQPGCCTGFDSPAGTPFADRDTSGGLRTAGSSFSTASSLSNMQPGTPAAYFSTPAASDTDYKKAFAPDACPTSRLVGQLQQLPAYEAAGMAAAAEEVSSRARSSSDDRQLLVSTGVVPALVQLLQLPLDSSAEGQPHAAASWALFHLLGRSKATPQGCAAAHAAMTAACAVKHVTAALKGAWKLSGSGGMYTDPLMASKLLRTTSSTASGVMTPAGSASPQQEVAARVQEAAAAALSGLATSPSGKAAMLQEGSVPSIIRLLGSRSPSVVAAAVSTVRNLSTPACVAVNKVLFRAGVCTMLVHVVACNSDPACKQNALRIMLDLLTSAPASPPASSTDLGTEPAQQALGTENYTADNVADRLVRRGLPAVLLKLLHAAPPVALQARAMRVLQLLAAQRQEVLVSIKDLVEYAFVVGQDRQEVSYTGVQVLQQLMRSESSSVQCGAVELLQALSDAGLIGRGARQASN